MAGGSAIYLPVMGSFRNFASGILKESTAAARDGSRAMAQEFAKGARKTGADAGKALSDGLSAAKGEVSRASAQLAKSQDKLLDQQGRLKIATKAHEKSQRDLMAAEQQLLGVKASLWEAIDHQNAAIQRHGRESAQAAQAVQALAAVEKDLAQVTQKHEQAENKLVAAQEKKATATRNTARAEEEATTKTSTHQAALAQLKAAQADVGKGADQVAQSQGRLSSALSNTGKAIVGAFAAGGAIAAMKNVLTVGMDFTNALNTMQAVSGATGGEMARVAAEARKLGNDATLPATSASKAANAMVELSKGGFSTADAMTAARGTLQLAAAAQVDAAKAAEIQANALNTFGLKAEYATKAADILANAANASSVEIEDVAYALQAGGAVAAQYGISMRDTASAIGLLGNAGIKGSDAGTLLKTALIHLANPTKQASLALDELRVTAWDAQGNFVGLPTIFAQLQEASKRLTPEIYAQDTALALGTDAARLAGVAAREGGEGFMKMATAVDRNGAAMEVAAARTKGLPGAWEAFQNSLEAVTLAIYGQIQGPISSFLLSLGDLVDGTMSFFGALGRHQAVVEAVAASLGVLTGAVVAYNVQQRVAAAGGIVRMLIALRTAAIGSTLAMLGLNTAMLANPIIWIVVAIAALVGGFVYLWNTSEGFRNFWIGLWNGIKEVVAGVWNWLKDAWNGLAAIFGEGTFTEALGRAFGIGADSPVVGFLLGLRDVAITAWNAISTGAQFLWSVVQTVFRGWAILWNGVLFPALRVLWDGILAPVFAAVGAGARILWSVVQTVFRGWVMFFSGVLFPIIRFLWNQVVAPVFRLIGDLIKGVWEGFVKPSIEGWVLIFKEVLAPVFVWLWKSVVEPVWNLIGKGIAVVVDKVIKPAFETFKLAIKGVGDFFSLVAEGIRVVWDKIKEYAAKPINFVIQTVWNDGLAKAWNKIADFIPGLVRANTLEPVRFAKGGHVRGPGTATSDSIPALLSNNEHVWDALDVSKAGGQGVMYAMRAAISNGVPFTWDAAEGLVSKISPENLEQLGKARPGQDAAGLLAGTLPGFKDGGAVDRPAWESQLARAHEWARSRSGRAYVLGGSADGDGGTDCSGYMSGVADVIQGGKGHRQWATMAFNGGGNNQAASGPQGFVAGLSGNSLSIGVKNGGAAGGHTAGTLSGVDGHPATNVESGGAHGNVAYGGPAAGADHSQFPTRYHLPIGPDGAFVSAGPGGGSGPSPEEQHGFLRDKVKQVMRHFMDPIKGLMSQVVGQAPPWWREIPGRVFDKSLDGAVDGAFSVANGLTSSLRSAYDAASSVVSGVGGGASGAAPPVSGPLLRDSGGPLPPGDSWVRNNTGKQEWVLTDEQWKRVRELMSKDHMAKEKAMEYVLRGGPKPRKPRKTAVDSANPGVESERKGRKTDSEAHASKPAKLESFRLTRQRSDANTDALSPGESSYEDRAARAPDKAGAANQSGSVIDWGGEMLSQGADALPGLVEQAIQSAVQGASAAAAGSGFGAPASPAVSMGGQLAAKAGKVAGMWAAHGIKTGINIVKGVSKDALSFLGFGYDEFTDPFGVFRQVAGQIDGIGQGQESTNQQTEVTPGEGAQGLAEQSIRGETLQAAPAPDVLAPIGAPDVLSPNLSVDLNARSARSAIADPISSALAQNTRQAPDVLSPTLKREPAVSAAPAGSRNPDLNVRANPLWGEGAPGLSGAAAPGARNEQPDAAASGAAPDVLSPELLDPRRLGIYDAGGVLPHGSLAMNTSGHDEYVVPPTAWSSLDDILKGKVSTGDKGVDADIAKQMGKVMKEKGDIQRAGHDGPLIKIDSIQANDPTEAARAMSEEARRLGRSNSLVGGR